MHLRKLSSYVQSFIHEGSLIILYLTVPFAFLSFREAPFTSQTHGGTNIDHVGIVGTNSLTNIDQRIDN